MTNLWKRKITLHVYFQNINWIIHCLKSNHSHFNFFLFFSSKDGQETDEEKC